MRSSGSKLPVQTLLQDSGCFLGEPQVWRSGVWDSKEGPMISGLRRVMAG